ncbi:MAG: ACP S-malonyltransferase [Bacillota bacterium]|nr:ACP S-malonyltransferase [Bacillota bacterium]
MGDGMRVAFLFPGQGAQYVGMGEDLYREYPVVREVFARAGRAAGLDLEELCFRGPAEQLNLTEHTQPAVLTVSWAVTQVLAAHGVVPDAAAGLSLGEYTALVAARALDFEEAVALVRRRGRYMQEAVPPGEGAMAAIMGMGAREVEEICRRAQNEGVVEPVNYNCPGQIVVAGHAGAVREAMRLAREAGARRVQELAVSAPFHSSLMLPARRRLAVDLAATRIADPALPVVANVHADYARSGEEVRRLLEEQVDHPVRWEDCVRRLVADGVGLFVEAGPGTVLAGFCRRICPEVPVFSVGDLPSLERLLEAARGSAAAPGGGLAAQGGAGPGGRRLDSRGEVC